MNDEKCQGRLRSSWGRSFAGSACGNRGKFEHNGKHFCGIHDPVVRKTKDGAKGAKWKAGYDAKNAAAETAVAIRAEQARKAACFDDLLAALQDVIGWVSGRERWHTDEPEKSVDRARAAIAKAATP